MRLSITLAEPRSPAAAADLGTLLEWFQADPRLAGHMVIQHQADGDQSLGLVQELIAPLTDLGADGLRVLPLAIAVWIKQRRSDLKVSYTDADGAKVVVTISRLRDPEAAMRAVIQEITEPERR